MKLKDLQYYQQLIKDRNFSQVAHHFGVSQPTITMAIQRLEREYGSAFFIRDHVHQQLHLTAAGQQFAAHVRVILNELQVAQNEIATIKSTKIRFGLPPIIGNYYFPSLTPALMRNGLLTHLESYEHGSRELLKMLQRGELDMALLGSLSSISQNQLQTIELGRYPFQIIVSPNNPLAKQKSVSFSQLRQHPFLVPDTEFFHEQAFKQMCHYAHVRPKVIYRTADIHVIKAMVAENLGIAYITSLAVAPEDHVVSLNLTDKNNPHFYISAATRQNEILSPLKQKLWKLLTTKK